MASNVLRKQGALENANYHIEGIYPFVKRVWHTNILTAPAADRLNLSRMSSAVAMSTLKGVAEGSSR
jgi:hypothetical protein